MMVFKYRQYLIANTNTADMPIRIPVSAHPYTVHLQDLDEVPSLSGDSEFHLRSDTAEI